MKSLPWIGLIVSVILLGLIVLRYPITIWDVENYSESPVTYSFMATQGLLQLPTGIPFEAISPAVAALGLIFVSLMASLSFSLFTSGGRTVPKLDWKNYIGFFAGKIDKNQRGIKR